MRTGEHRDDADGRREGHPRGRRDRRYLDQAVRRARDPVQRAEPAHVPGDALHRHGCGEFISGVIMHDETIRQKSSGGTPLVQVLSSQGIVPGIKVDTGAKPLAAAPGETITEGLDGLRDRLAEYHGMGARFAKWRAVIRIADTLPSPACVSANAHALGRYAALCQEQRLVPIVEPEVLMDGSHSIERSEEVTGMVLHAVFQCPPRAACLAGSHAAQAQHGHRGHREPSSGFRTAGRDGHAPLPAPARARGRTRASCSCRAARGTSWRPPTSTRSTGYQGPSRGRSASPTGARSRIRRWRPGTDGTRI